MDHSIVSLIFKNINQTKVLSRINIQDKVIIKNNSLKNLDLKKENDINFLINELKIIYEDIWKEYNQINTSIKLSLYIRVDNEDLDKSLNFEKTLKKIDLISDYSINKFDKRYVFYEVVFNGTPDNFINILKEKNYKFDTQKKIWILK